MDEKNEKKSEFFNKLLEIIQKENEKDKMNGISNPACEDIAGSKFDLESNNSPLDIKIDNQYEENAEKNIKSVSPPRDTWGNGLEFLMSCIAMSVGLGNIWRFPFTAYENGGGAFLIPYIIVLFLVGKPVYYIEMILGQFSSKGSVKVYDFSPALRGAGSGQTLAVVCVMSYYSSLMALILYYLIASFSAELPWSVCDPSWTNCYPAGNSESVNSTIGLKSSTELYFIRTVLRELDNIYDGIGTPEWKLTLCLLGSWFIVYLILLRGVKSSGKAAYFLAIFPYVIMLVLLIRAVTLPGAKQGIIFFINPDFGKILDPKVWYAAVTQCFFSLSVCFGNVIMYASYNRFTQNIYRDALIVTSLDTVTSLLAGFTIFGILGNLAYESGAEVKNVVKGGPMLAFVSYPEAISKFTWAPQVFSVLFFLMLFVLGVGSNIAMASCIITVIRDKFPKIHYWKAASVLAACGFLVSLVYITPGGQFILNLVDHHGGSFIVYMLGIVELVAVFWVYGVRAICDDVEFMLKRGVSWYFRICWSVVTPVFLIFIMLYTLVTLRPIEYNGVEYPTLALFFGWLISAIGILQVPLLAGLAFWRRRQLGDIKTIIKNAFAAKLDWGPTDPELKSQWLSFKAKKALEREDSAYNKTRLRKVYDEILGY